MRTRRTSRPPAEPEPSYDLDVAENGSRIEILWHGGEWYGAEVLAKRKRDAQPAELRYRYDGYSKNVRTHA